MRRSKWTDRDPVVLAFTTLVVVIAVSCVHAADLPHQIDRGDGRTHRRQP